MPQISPLSWLFIPFFFLFLFLVLSVGIWWFIGFFYSFKLSSSSSLEMSNEDFGFFWVW